MLASAVRELVASTNPSWIAAAFFETTVQIWDVESSERISEFPAVFCSGAKNLAIAPHAQMLLTGASTSSGKVAAYEIPSGTMLWRRKFTYPSSLRFHSSGESVLFSDNHRTSIRLDVRTGATLEVIEGVSQYIEGPYGDILSVPARSENEPFRLIGKGSGFDIARLGFALLDAQFSPESVCLTEAVGPVRCINCTDGRERWRFDPGRDSQILLLHYSSETDAFFGVLRHLVKGGSRHLVKFDTKSGACERICALDSWDEVFLESADQLVTSSGEIKDLSNGALVGRLGFPLKQYPND